MTSHRPLRVLVYTETYSVGGCDRFLADLASHLDAREAHVHFAGSPHQDLDDYLAARIPGFAGRENVRIASMREPALGRLAFRLGLSSRAAIEQASAVPAPATSGDSVRARIEQAVVDSQRLAQNARNVLTLRALIRRHRPDVVHANNGGYPGAESVRIIPIAAQLEHVPSIQFVHNMAQPVATPSRVERAIDARIDSAVSTWVTAAHRASEALAHTRHLPRDRVTTVHYGIGLPRLGDHDPAARAELGFLKSAPGVLVVAAFEPRKGHLVLLDALARLRQGGTVLQAALVGVGADRAAVEAKALDLGLKTQVKFMGWRDDVDRLIRASDILALPSLGQECLPYAILEAMGHSTPVVATDVAGIPEMVADGQTGRVVPPGEPEALAEALGQLALDPRLRARLGAAGRERIETEFSVDTMAAAMLELWTRAASSRHV